MTKMNLFMKQKQTHRHREKTWLLRRRGSGGGMDCKFGNSRFKLIYIELINNRSYCIAQGTIFNIL